MSHMLRAFRPIACATAIVSMLAAHAHAHAHAQKRMVTATVTNLAPTNSVSFARRHVGFHQGLLDEYEFSCEHGPEPFLQLCKYGCAEQRLLPWQRQPNAGFNGLTTAAGYVFDSQLEAGQNIYRIDFAVATVPEPSTVVLLSGALLVMALMMHRRRAMQWRSVHPRPAA